MKGATGRLRMSKVKQRFLLIIHVNHAFGTYAAWILLLDDKDEGTLPRNVSWKGTKWGEKAYSPFALVVGYCGNVTSAFGKPLKGQCGIALLDSVFPSTKHPTPTTFYRPAGERYFWTLHFLRPVRVKLWGDRRSRFLTSSEIKATLL